jgi:hypothetical protein
VEKKIRLGNPSHIKTQVFAETKFSPLSGHNGSEWVVSAMFRQARRLARLKMGRIETAKKKKKDWILGHSGFTINVTRFKTIKLLS